MSIYYYRFDVNEESGDADHDNSYNGFKQVIMNNMPLITWWWYLFLQSLNNKFPAFMLLEQSSSVGHKYSKVTIDTTLKSSKDASYTSFSLEDPQIGWTVMILFVLNSSLFCRWLLLSENFCGSRLWNVGCLCGYSFTCVLIFCLPGLCLPLWEERARVFGSLEQYYNKAYLHFSVKLTLSCAGTSYGSNVSSGIHWWLKLDLLKLARLPFL